MRPDTSHRWVVFVAIAIVLVLLAPIWGEAEPPPRTNASSPGLRATNTDVPASEDETPDYWDTPDPYGTPTYPPPPPTPSCDEVFFSVADTYVSEWEPTENKDGQPLKVRQGGVYRVLLQFDLSSIPEGAEITQAGLHLFVESCSNPTPHTLTGYIHNMLKWWEEDQATWQKPHNWDPWQVAGAKGAEDADQTAAATMTFDQVANWASADVTDLVNTWVSNHYMNHGLMIVGSGPTSIYYAISSNDHWIPEQRRPRLYVCWGDAEPTPEPDTPTPTVTPTVTKTYTPWPTDTRRPSSTPVISPTPTPPVTVYLDAVEVSQGIQNLGNDMDLISGRRTIVRAYLHSDPYSVRVAAQITARRGGWDVGRAINANANTRVSTLTTTVFTDPAHREGHGNAAWFEIPPDWYGIGGDPVSEITVRLFYGNQLPRPEITIPLRWQQGPSVGVVWVPEPLHQHGDPNQPILMGWPFASGFAAIADGITRYHPITGFTWGWMDPAESGPGGLTIDMRQRSGRSELLYDVAWQRQVNTYMGADFGMPAAHWVGLVHPGIDTGGGLGMARTPGTALWIKQDAGSSGWYVNGAASLAHELGHNRGLKHWACAASSTPGVPAEANPDPSWPGYSNWSNCSLAAVDLTGYYGLDVYFRAYGMGEPAIISNDPGSANAGFPLMSYARPRWIAPAEYCRLMNSFGLRCSQTDPSMVAALAEGEGNVRLDPNERELMETSESHWLVSGWVDEAGTAGGISALREFSGANPSAIQQTLIELTARQAQGVGLTLQPTYLLVQKDGDNNWVHTRDLGEIASEGVPGGPFVETLPRVEGAVGLQLLADDKLLDERWVSTHAPWVHVEWPNGGEFVEPGDTVRWTAVDNDGDALVYDVHYSADGGATWRMMAHGLQDSEWSFPWNDFVPGTDDGVMRVAASDGFHTAMDTSDDAFSVAFRAPYVMVTSLDWGQEFPLESDILLSCVAFDPEEGILEGDDVTWYLGDEQVGHGNEVVLQDVEYGTHWVSAVSQDSFGNEDSDGRLIHVGMHRIPLPAILKRQNPDGEDVAARYADRLLDYNPGQDAIEVMTDADTVLGPPNDLYEPWWDQWLSLGIGGQVTVEWCGRAVKNGEGWDIRVHGDPNNNDSVEVWVSYDGESYDLAGTVGEDLGTVDLADLGLSWVRQVRIVAPQTAEIAAIEAATLGSPRWDVGSPYPDQVVSYYIGPDAYEVAQDPNAVLGPPDQVYDPCCSGWLSMGRGGSVELRWSQVEVVDAWGADLRLYGDPSLNERVTVHLTNDKGGWGTFANIPENAYLDLREVGLDSVRTIIIEDDSMLSASGSTSAEIDAVEALHYDWAE